MAVTARTASIAGKALASLRGRVRPYQRTNSFLLWAAAHNALWDEVSAQEEVLLDASFQTDTTGKFLVAPGSRLCLRVPQDRYIKPALPYFRDNMSTRACPLRGMLFGDGSCLWYDPYRDLWTTENLAKRYRCQSLDYYA
jgi:hypothetical protein